MSLEKRPRVIIHIDLDAFYCQVEQKRHGIPREVPCAVQQWEGLIAVNYAARAAGVTRHMRVGEARKICPQLRTVHVETIGEGGSRSPPGRSQAGGGGGGGGGGASAARRNEAKASLQPYRQASGEIMRVLGGLLVPGCLLEKASVDEAFLDVTSMAEDELRRLEGSGGGGGGGTAAAGRGPEHDAPGPRPEPAAAEVDEWGLAGQGLMGSDGAGGDSGDGGMAGGSAVSSALLSEARRVVEASVVVGGPPDLLSETDRRLVVGALIALRLRQAVRAELDFTCSAGVSTNKLLAKVGSARNKPDKQTLVLPRGVADMMQDMPLGKLRGLGGKLGASLEQHFSATTAGQVQKLPLEQLQRALGERTGLWVSQIVRGQCTEPVTPKSKPKSLLSCKSFEPTRDSADLSRWLAILAEELAQRCREDEAANRRRARTLVLHYRGTGPRERSVRCAMPPHGREGPSPAAIAKASLEMLRRQPDALPCSRLAIAATEFDDPPAAGARAITRFFAQPRPHPQPQQQQQQELRERAAAPHLQQPHHHQQPQPHQHHQQQQRHPLTDYGGGIEADATELAPWGNDGDGNNGDGDDGGGGFCDRGSEDENVEGDDGGGGDDGGDDGGGDDDGGFVMHRGAAGASAAGTGPAHPQPPQPPLQGAADRRQQQQHQEEHYAAPQRLEGPSARPSKKLRLEDTEHGRASSAQRNQQQQQQLPQQHRQHQPHQRQQQPAAWPASLDCWLREGDAGGVAAVTAAAAAGTECGARPRVPPAAEEDDDFGFLADGRAGVTEEAAPPVSLIHVADDENDAAGAAGAAASTGLNRETDIDLVPHQDPCPGPGAGPGPAPDPDPDPTALDLLSGVDLDEQRRILHDIELARLRAVGRARTPSGAGVGHGDGGGGGAGGRRGGGGGPGRGRGRGSAAAAAPVKGQTRLTALLQPRKQQ